MAKKEYIEREELIEYLETAKQKLLIENSFESRWAAQIIGIFICLIENFAAADVAPVRHGRWKKSKGNERPTENGFVHDDRYVCDCCGWGCCCETKLDFSFCPNCGARMDGDADANGNDNKTPET